MLIFDQRWANSNLIDIEIEYSLTTFLKKYLGKIFNQN